MEITLVLQKSTKNFHKYAVDPQSRFLYTLYIPLNEMSTPSQYITINITPRKEIV